MSLVDLQKRLQKVHNWEIESHCDWNQFDEQFEHKASKNHPSSLVEREEFGINSTSRTISYIDFCIILKICKLRKTKLGIEMHKIDYKKEFKDLFNPPYEKVVVVDVPELNFLMVDGIGEPNASNDYKDAVEALLAVSSALKFDLKNGKLAVDYDVMPIEGLWWTEKMDTSTELKKDVVKWTSLVMQPEFVTNTMFRCAVEFVEKKKHLPALPKLRFEKLHEGLSAQIMYLGPYSAEKTTVDKIRSFIKENGYVETGKHHEIYLTDPRKSESTKTKTILRRSMKKQ